MKRRLLNILFCALLVSACDPEPVLIGHNGAVTDSNHTGVFILSEGLYNQNNSTLAWIDFSTGQPDSWNSSVGRSFDCFEKSNGRRIGDTANDMILYGSRLYIAVSESSTIEILDAATCRSIRQVKMEKDGIPAQPRHLAAHDGYVYVCCFNGTVERIDTLTMKPDATVSVGRNPDGICFAGGKLYVSNSGGLDFTHPDSTVSVIDLNTFTEKKRITVRSNPGTIRTDGTSVFVVSRGIFDYGTMDYDCLLHRIDVATDLMTDTYDIPVLNMDIVDGKAWIYRYGSGTIQVMETETGQILQSCFITDGTSLECPYSINVGPVSGKVYICDAADYVTPGSLYCFSSDGKLEYRITGIGINPNTIQFCDINVNPVEAGNYVQQNGPVSKVFSYSPAPGQFVNLMPQYEDGDDEESMKTKCLSALQGGELITLGGFGGYITVGFNTPIHNLDGYDFRIDGNAITNGAEPGVVWVSTDANGNGMPDDRWYEIQGSEQKAGRSVSGYTVRYRKPAADDGDCEWTGSDGRTGSVSHNNFHKQPYYPQWYTTDDVTFTATLLPDNMTYSGGLWKMTPFGYGYADNLPNSDVNSAFDIDWAVNPDGTPANLASIDFIKVQTGVIGCNNLTGEESTEIKSITNLNP